MSGPVFVDTNVIVSARDGRFPTQQARCVAWLRALAASRTMVISVQVLKEHRSVLRRKLGFDDRTAHSATRALFEWCTAPLGVSEIDQACHIERQHRTSWWDALMLASAEAAGCAYFLSEDAQSAPVINGIRVLDPAATPPGDILDRK